MVRAYRMTYGLPTIFVHASNTYGPRQYPEKLIPHIILSGGRPLPVYSEGLNVRDWLHVDDLAEGLERVLAHGAPGETYNFAAGDERRNIDTVKMICARLHQAATYGFRCRSLRDRLLVCRERRLVPIRARPRL